VGSERFALIISQNQGDRDSQDNGQCSNTGERFALSRKRWMRRALRTANVNCRGDAGPYLRSKSGTVQTDSLRVVSSVIAAPPWALIR
jgi:hypothetical protein